LKPSDNTYEIGYLGPKGDKLKIVDIEAFGCGGDEALENQRRAKELARKEVDKARKIDKGALLDDFTKEYMLENTFKHKKEEENRE